MNRSRVLSLALTVALIGLASCGSTDQDSERIVTSTTTTTAAATSPQLSRESFSSVQRCLDVAGPLFAEMVRLDRGVGETAMATCDEAIVQIKADRLNETPADEALIAAISKLNVTLSLAVLSTFDASFDAAYWQQEVDQDVIDVEAALDAIA